MTTQSEYEQRELAVAELHRRFLCELVKAPEIQAAFNAWREAELAAFEARRDRRESELTNG